MEIVVSSAGCVDIFIRIIIWLKKCIKTRRLHAENKKQKAAGRFKRNFDEAYTDQISAQNFTFHELAYATKNFFSENLVGEGGFSRVYKGTLQGSKEVIDNSLM